LIIARLLLFAGVAGGLFAGGLFASLVAAQGVPMVDFACAGGEPFKRYSGPAWQAICSSTRLRVLYQTRIALGGRLSVIFGEPPTPADYVAVRRHMPTPTHLAAKCKTSGLRLDPHLPLLPPKVEDCIARQLIADNAALERLSGRPPVAANQPADKTGVMATLCSTNDLSPGAEQETICASQRLRALLLINFETADQLSRIAPAAPPYSGPTISEVCDIGEVASLPPGPLTEDCIGTELGKRIAYLRDRLTSRGETR
jgi:hypothetical protein